MLATGPAVGLHKGRRVEHSNLRHQFNNVFINGRSPETVLVAAESVDRMRKIQLQAGGTFRGGHHAVFLTGCHHPLPLRPITNEVGL